MKLVASVLIILEYFLNYAEKSIMRKFKSKALRRLYPNVEQRKVQTDLWYFFENEQYIGSESSNGNRSAVS